MCPSTSGSGGFFGYGLVNFVSHEAAGAALTQLNLQHFEWPVDEDLQSEYLAEPIKVSWSEGRQGLDAYVEKYRNSPVMHAEVPEEFKPSVFRSGLRVSFPAPTEEVQFPLSFKGSSPNPDARKN